MVTVKKGFEKQITKELILRVAETEEEGKFLAVFNSEIHGEELHDYILRLYNEHPNRDEILWFYIEDISTEDKEDKIEDEDEQLEESNNDEEDQEREKIEQNIVASLALLPLKWKIRGHEFGVAEMGFVGTKQSYRGQGLFGIMNNYFDLAVKEREYVLSSLVGIPYFYRKYGYEFALSKLTGYSMPTNNIPKEEMENIKVRKATVEDLDEIKEFYNKSNKDFAVSTVFDADKLKFRLMNTTCDIFYSITYVIEEDRELQGFFSIGSIEDPQRADIILHSKLTNQQMIKMLQFVKDYNMGNINAYLIVVDRRSQLANYLKSRGADLVTDWTWQVKIPELLPFFKAMTPVFEERIEESIFRNLTKLVKISNYADTVTLEFVDGKIKNIDISREFPSAEVDLRIPAPHNIRLFLSDRSFDELKYIITDTIVKKDSKLLIETLFPKIPSIPFSFYQ